MRYIRIPANASFTIATKDGPVEAPLVFKRILVELLDNAPQFGTRAAARKAVFIEKAIEEGEDSIALDSDQYDLLLAAMNGFSWIPQAAKIMERAGWFAAIEEATDSEPKREPKLVTNSQEKSNA